MSEHINNLIFVFTHSALIWPFAVLFTALGFWQGYVWWSRWEDELQLALQRRSNLRSQIAKIKRKNEELLPAAEGDISISAPSWISIFRGEFDIIDIDSELGVVYTERPPVTDDLTLLSGVDGGRASQLQNAGIYTFKQLGAMDTRQRANLQSRFGDINWTEVLTQVVGPDYTYSVAA